MSILQRLQVLEAWSCAEQQGIGQISSGPLRSWVCGVSGVHLCLGNFVYLGGHTCIKAICDWFGEKLVLVNVSCADSLPIVPQSRVLT